ncbi:MAG: hypothetical protein JRN52_07850 [Nitrososphaerota archaeon]|nr:hypothetical protein [Nitrososphaerota archaeon]
MSKYLQYLGIPLAIVLAYAFNLYVPVVWVGVIAALPLLKLRKSYSLVFGFLVGLLVPMSLYLFYPLLMVMKLSAIVSQIASIPSVLVIVIFPLFYGIIMGLSGLFWSGLAENSSIGGGTRNQPESGASIKSTVERLVTLG